MNATQYWKESLREATADLFIAMSEEALQAVAESLVISHENYGLAFHTPDRRADADSEWKAKYEALEKRFSEYRELSEVEMKKALRQPKDAMVRITDSGVIRLDGRTVTLQ